MKKILLLIFFFNHAFCIAQQDTTIQKLEIQLEKEQTTEGKIEILRKLAYNSDFVRPEQCQNYLDKSIFLAEQSRDKNLMIQVRINAAALFILNGILKDRIKTAKRYAQEALTISKQDGVSYKNKVMSHTLMARIMRFDGNATDALNYKL